MDDKERYNLDLTLDHRERVGHLIREFVNQMMKRAIEHDRSKFEEPEFSEFAQYVPELEKLEYGSEEYKNNLQKLKSPALDNHYSNNDHHIEHHGEIEEMDLLQVLEMFLDWCAATERHDDGNDIFDSIEHHYKQGEISKQTAAIFRNTATTLEKKGVI